MGVIVRLGVALVIIAAALGCSGIAPAHAVGDQPVRCRLAYHGFWVSPPAPPGEPSTGHGTITGSGTCVTQTGVTVTATLPDMNPENEPAQFGQGLAPIGLGGILPFVSCTPPSGLTFPLQAGFVTRTLTWNRVGLVATALGLADPNGMLTLWNTGRVGVSEVTLGTLTDPATGAPAGTAISRATFGCNTFPAPGGQVTVAYAEDGTVNFLIRS